MSSRWSYGPEGLRERPTRRWSEAELLPRWRELQPLLIRSAGVVGIAATIMAVVSSDALRFGGDIPSLGRNDRAAATDRADSASAAPIVAAQSELGARDGAAPPPAASAPAAVATLAKLEAPAPSLAPSAPATPLISELRTGRAADAAAESVASVQPVHAPAADHLPQASPDPVPDARTAGAPAASGPAGPEMAASVSPPSATASGQTAADSGEPSVWLPSATGCPRDWVGVAAGSAGSAACPATAEVIASLAEGDQSSLEEAAGERAEALGLVAPRIPVPRPAIAPPVKPARVARASNGWPAGPPPNCSAGQHAKWRFVDRRAGTKEWYCK